MPTYHYRCNQCEQHLEVVQKMTDDPITVCAACGGEMQKVLKPIGIVLKGSGFYRTDHRSPRRAGGTESSDSTGESKTSESKTSDSKTSESKPSDSKTSDSKSKSSDSSSSSSTTSSEAKSATA